MGSRATSEGAPHCGGRRIWVGGTGRLLLSRRAWDRHPRRLGPSGSSRSWHYPTDYCAVPSHLVDQTVLVGRKPASVYGVLGSPVPARETFRWRSQSWIAVASASRASIRLPKTGGPVQRRTRSRPSHHILDRCVRVDRAIRPGRRRDWTVARSNREGRRFSRSGTCPNPTRSMHGPRRPGSSCRTIVPDGGRRPRRYRPPAGLPGSRCAIRFRSGRRRGSA